MRGCAQDLKSSNLDFLVLWVAQLRKFGKSTSRSPPGELILFFTSSKNKLLLKLKPGFTSIFSNFLRATWIFRIISLGLSCPSFNA
jgi:hypothetical protein